MLGSGRDKVGGGSRASWVVLQVKIPPGIVGVSEVAGEEGKERVRVVLWFGQTRSNRGLDGLIKLGLGIG